MPTLSFRLLFGLLILRHDRREILWLGVTAHPTAEWLAQQVTEAISWEKPPKYLLRDRDRVYGDAFIRRIAAMGIRDRPTAARSPWQNGYCERAIGSIRRDCLDYVIVLGRAPPSPCAALLCELLQLEPNTPVLKQGCADEATSSNPRQHRSDARPRRPAPSLRSCLIFRQGQDQRSQVRQKGRRGPQAFWVSSNRGSDSCALRQNLARAVGRSLRRAPVLL